jgi:hypothetical protein
MTTHGTATLGQLVQIVNPLLASAATAADGYDLSQLSKALRDRNEDLAHNLSLVFTAMTTGQQLILQGPTDPQTQQPIPSKLLGELVGSMTPVKTVERFAVADHFRTGEVKGVRIAFVSDNFREKFGKKVEQNTPPGQIHVYRLIKDSLDAPIITVLGDKHELTLAELWQLVADQGQGEKGPLLTDGYANICYVRADQGVLWAVDAFWDGGGWGFSAGSVGAPAGGALVTRCCLATIFFLPT